MVREAQEHRNWLESLTRGISGEGQRGATVLDIPSGASPGGLINRNTSRHGQANRPLGYGPLLKEYVYFLSAKLAFHRQHPEFNGMSTIEDCYFR